MTYKAKGLPKGLKLNRKTGLITGSTNTNGNFKVRLQATNEKGTDEKEITLKIGSEIMLTPPMGWNSWNCWRFAADDQKYVMRPNHARKASGLRMDLCEHR